jgi:glycerate-2-kinase
VFNQILKTAIDSINPRYLLNKCVKVTASGQTSLLSVSSCYHSNNNTIKNDASDALNGQVIFELNQNVYVCAFGKAALAMSLQIENIINSANIGRSNANQNSKSHLVKGIAILPFSQIIGDKEENQHWSFLPDGRILPKLHPESKFEFYYGAQNNLPDKLSLNATKKVIDMIQTIDKDKSVLLCLISGGGSALLSYPKEIITNKSSEFNGQSVDESLLLTKNSQLKLETIKKVVKSGANINELNTIRSCLSKVKAYNLAKLVLSTSNSVSVVSLIISDVIDDPLDIIASGPTILPACEAAKNKYAKSLEIISKYQIESTLPRAVIEFLSEMKQRDKCACADANQNKVFNFLIGNNKLATNSMVSKLEEMNFDFCRVITNGLDGEAKLVGAVYAFVAYLLAVSEIKDVKTAIDSIKSYDDDKFKFLKAVGINSIHSVFSLLQLFLTKIDGIQSLNGKDVVKIGVLSGGETTVDLSTCTEPGVGGRNQEMTLSFEYVFANLIKAFSVEEKHGRVYNVVFSSFGTDGIDGPTDAAGAFSTFENSTPFSEVENANIIDSLAKHDSYNYFSKCNRLIKTGATGTNVSDLQVLLVELAEQK